MSHFRHKLINKCLQIYNQLNKIRFLSLTKYYHKLWEYLIENNKLLMIKIRREVKHLLQLKKMIKKEQKKEEKIKPNKKVSPPLNNYKWKKLLIHKRLFLGIESIKLKYLVKINLKILLNWHKNFIEICKIYIFTQIKFKIRQYQILTKFLEVLFKNKIKCKTRFKFRMSK